jgi:hypothetical protein
MAVQKIRAELMAKVSTLAPGEQQGAIQAISSATNSVDLLKLSYYDLGETIKERLVGNLVDAQISQEGFSKVIGDQQAAFNATIQSAAEYNRVLKDISSESRTFSAGWNKAFNDYVSNASNAATIATGLFNKFSSGIEDYFIDRLKGVQGGWKKFLASLAEELARSTLRQGLARIFSGIGFGSLGRAAGGTGGKGDSLTNPLYVKEISGKGSLFGGSSEGQGAKTSESGTSMFDDIKTAITDFASGVGNFMSNMFSGLGNFVSNFTSGLGSILSQIGGTLFDVIGSIGGTLFDVIGSLGSGLGDILGSVMGGGGGGGILSTLFDIGASLFGFANGGVIPNNKPVLVGERGPEILFGAGGMGVMSNQDAFGGGSTVVTYNINAVDALSFKQMIAQDPTFLYAVTQQGAKGMPVRR